MKKISSLELLSPAGDWASLQAACQAGCDSVYFGIKGINMRHAATNFDMLELKNVMQDLHGQGRRGYLTLNTLIQEDDLGRCQRILSEARLANVDAVICWDMAVLQMAQDEGVPIHLSTQASVANTKALAWFAKQGVRRVVLARECSLDQIREMKKQLQQNHIDCQLEAFVHGAMCVSISGRCFLSHDVFQKSANQGACLQPCRRKFRITDLDGESEFVIGEDYVLSPKDLCMIRYVDALIDAGIDAFKIEGRMRSPEYVKTVTSVYRRAIDDYKMGLLDDPRKENYENELKQVYHRGFSTGFYFGQPQDISRGYQHLFEKVYVGDVKRFFKKIQVAEVRLRSMELRKGDEVLFIGPKTPAYQMTVGEMQRDNQSIVVALKGETIGLKLPFMVKPKDKLFLWRKK